MRRSRSARASVDRSAFAGFRFPPEVIADEVWVRGIASRIAEYRSRAQDLRPAIERCVTQEDYLRLARDIEEVKGHVLERLGMKHVELATVEKDLAREHGFCGLACLGRRDLGSQRRVNGQGRRGPAEPVRPLCGPQVAPAAPWAIGLRRRLAVAPRPTKGCGAAWRRCPTSPRRRRPSREGPECRRAAAGMASR